MFQWSAKVYVQINFGKLSSKSISVTRSDGSVQTIVCVVRHSYVWKDEQKQIFLFCSDSRSL